MPELVETGAQRRDPVQLVELASIQEAEARLPEEVRGTPVLRCSDGSWLKLESLQPTGSFKLRGAFTKLSRLGEEARAEGVIAYSSGNHGLAVARAARLCGTSATIVLPSDAPSSKVAAITREGATLIPCAPGSEERRLLAEQIAQSTGQSLVPPYDDPDVIAGQGTIGLEILEQVANLSAVVVPIGGGGLISGIASAIKALLPSVRVVGVEPELAADARDSLSCGELVELPVGAVARTVADAVRTQSLGALTFAHVRALVDEVVTVSEEEILAAATALLRDYHLVAEPAGALSLAALLFGRVPSPGAVAVISGGNVSADVLAEMLRRVDDDEASVLQKVVSDRPRWDRKEEA